LAPALVRSSPGAEVKVVFDHVVFETPVICLPGVLLGDGGPSDRFLSGGADKPKRLAATLAAIDELCARHPMDYRVLQLGDWFDLHQAGGGEPTFSDASQIEDVGAYAEILRLDAKLGLSHVIGNHDATFLACVPASRKGSPERFRLGFWLGNNVYALHGHEGSLVFDSAPASERESRLQALASTLAELVPSRVAFSAYVEVLRASPPVKRWLRETLGVLHPDPELQPREPDGRSLPPGVHAAAFVERENVDHLLSVVREVERVEAPRQRRVEVVLAGHGREAAVSWSTTGGRPMVLLDVGTWVGPSANILVAAGNTAAVFDVRAA
jgi:hypothetical protein